MNVLSNCFEKQMSKQRKPMSAQNGSENVRRMSDDVRRTSSEINKKRVSGSERGKEDKTHDIRRIHTRLPYPPLETPSHPDRQEPQHARLYHKPQEQALPDPVKTLDGLSSTAAAAFRKNLRIHTTKRRTF